MLIIWLNLLATTGTVLPNQFQFRHYNIENGLSSNTVSDILQDQKGYIWMATDGGLNCFDGTTFTYIQKGNPYYPELQTNLIQNLCEVNADELWFGTDYGVYIYNQKKNEITTFRKETADSISIHAWIDHIICDRNNRVWIASRGQGVFCYDTQSEQLTHYAFPKNDSVVLRFLCDQKGILWASSRKGLYKLNSQTNQFEAFPLHGADDGDFYAMALWEDPTGNLWAGTWKQGLWKIDRESGRTTRYIPPQNGKGAFHIHSIASYTPDILFIGSDDGLTVFNLTAEESTFYPYYGEDTSALSGKFIYPILKDREGGVWLGTFYNGINYLPPYSGQFEGYSLSDDNPLFQGKVISRFCEDKNGKIWIASDDGGLSCFSPAARKFEDFRGRAAFDKDNVHGLCLDGDELWIGTYTKPVRVLNLKTGAIRSYDGNESVSIYTIFKDSRKRIWAGSLEKLCRYDREKDSFVCVKNIGSMVIEIAEDPQGYLWIATQGHGLFRYQPETGKWKQYGTKEGFDNPTINHLHIDRKSRLWVATAEGLYLYQPSKDYFSRQLLNIPNEYINAMVEEEGALWLTTAKGLIKYVPGEGTKQVFTRSDGLQSEAFISASALKARNGDIYVGSINGFNRFTPGKLKQNTQPPAVVLTGLEIFNHAIKPEKGGILPASLDRLDEIHLSYKDNVITLKYAALSYCTPQKNQYAYKLEGFDKDWNFVGSQNSTTYTNLPAGTYRFRVKAANNDNVWNEEGTSIRIVIHPPFYLSLPFKVAYFLLSFLALGLFIRYIVRRSDKKHAKAIDELNIRKEKEMHEAKIKFFTMIAHEIRTPVSLIIGPLEKVMQSTPNLSAEVRKDLDIIDRNSQRLLFLVNQLLDFRKVEQNEMKMRFVSQNIKDIMEAVCERFRPSMEQHGVTFTVTYPDDNFRADIDREAVTKVLSNLLTNANKYTHSRIDILFETQPGQQTFSISVNDDGRGMKPEELKLIFQPFYQAADNKPGTGIGLSIVKGIVEAHHGRIEVKSETDKGSSFRVILPVRQKNAELNDSEQTDSSNLPEDILPEQSAGQSNRKLPVILIAEDNEDMIRFLSDSLQPNYTIITANDGVEALERLKEQEVSLIVSDWMMPNMDGVEFCKAVRNDQLSNHIPFILLTAKTDNASKTEGMNCGADAYIEKPFSLQYLEACIKNLLDLRMQLRKKFSSMPTVPISSIARNQEDEKFLTRMNQLIEENLDSPNLSIDFLAEQLYISRSALFAKIKGLANLTPNEMIQLIRLKKAASLLLENKYHISEVSYMVGFNNPSYFSKCFQKQFGMTPGKFIESHKEKAEEKINVRN